MVGGGTGAVAARSRPSSSVAAFPERPTLDTSLLELAVALIVTFAGAAVQASIGFGFAVVSIPVLALVDSSLVPVPQLLVSFPLAALMMRRERAHVDFEGVKWILVGRFIGAVASIPLLVTLDGRALELAIGSIVLLLTLVAGSNLAPGMTRTTQVGAGAFSGMTGLLASIGGPPLAILYRNAAGARLRSSLAAVFLIGLSTSLVIRIATAEISLDDLWIALALLPALLAGYGVGARLSSHVDRRGIRVYVLTGSALASLALIVKAVF